MLGITPRIGYLDDNVTDIRVAISELNSFLREACGYFYVGTSSAMCDPKVIDPDDKFHCHLSPHGLAVLSIILTKKILSEF